MANVSRVTLEEVAQLVKVAFERIEALESRAGQGAADGPTPRVINEDLKRIDPDNCFVFDVSGRTDYYKDRDSGLNGFWVKSKAGKKILVDIMGVPFFADNPLREKAYASHAVRS